MEKPHFDRLVGIKDMPNIPNDAPRDEVERIISDTLENEGGKFIEGLELEKTEQDREIIELASQEVNQYLQQYGRENVPEIPLNNIHLLKEGGTEEYTNGDLRGGGASSVKNSVIIDRGTSDLRLAQTLFHELYHQKVYKALQITKEDEPKLTSYHTGFKIISRDGEKIYFRDLEEALTSLAEQKFFTEVLANEERFRAEIEGMTVEEKSSLFTRNGERDKFNALVDKLWEENKEQFDSRDAILNMFFEAQATGRLLKVARLIEKTFGKGSFREIGEGEDITKIADYDKSAGDTKKDLRDEEVIENILESGAREEWEELMAFHKLTSEQLQLMVGFAKERRSAVDRARGDLRERIERNPIPTDEEINAGVYLEQLEPQVRNAVLTLRRKGYITYISGFHGYEKQIIAFHNEPLKDFKFPSDLMRELAEKGVYVQVKPGEIMFSCDYLLTLEELKDVWEQIAATLPDLGISAGSLEYSPSGILSKGIKWKKQADRIDKIVDRLGEDADDNIKEALTALNVIGLPTSSSCEGHIDHGVPAPWIHIEAPNEPTERFIGEMEMYKKIADKYNVPIANVKRGIQTKEMPHGAWAEAWEAWKKLKEETPEYTEWRRENNKLEEKLQKLLNEFYHGRDADIDLQIRIGRMADCIRLYNGGEDRRKIKVPPNLTDEQKTELIRRLALRQQEINDFSKFLKDKFFTIN